MRVITATLSKLAVLVRTEFIAWPSMNSVNGANLATWYIVIIVLSRIVPTSVLVLWSPRSVHLDTSWLWEDRVQPWLAINNAFLAP